MHDHVNPGPHRQSAIRVAAIAVCVAALSACSGDDDGTAAPAVDLSGAVSIELASTSVRALFTTLSGDGRLAAYPSAGEMCIAEIGSTAERCAEAAPTPWEASLRFSPDGSQVLFVDDFVRQLSEPDIRMLDIATMEVSNLTDDGVDTVGLGGNARTGSTDLAATWMPDGSIVFVRSEGVDGTPVLMRMTPGEEPAVVADLADVVEAIELVFPLEPVGTDAVAGITVPVSGDAEMITVDLDSGERSTVATFDESVGRVELVGISEPAGLALVAYTDAIALGLTDRPAHALVELESGRVRPLLDGVDDVEGNPVRSALAVLTPDGTAVVFGRAEFDRLGLYSVPTEAALGTVGFDDVARVGALPAEFSGDEVLGWNPAAAMVWTGDSDLIGLVGFEAVATVTFGDPG